MKAFIPDFIFGKTINITPEFLKKQGIKNLILDIDNTLTTHGNPIPAKGIEDWMLLMRQNGIKMVVASNNHQKRVGAFAKKIGLEFIHFSAKPSPLGLWRAMRKIGATRRDTAMVGDQIFTDILGAHIAGVKAILVIAILEEKGIGFKLKRNFEKKYIDRYVKTKGDIL